MPIIKKASQKERQRDEAEHEIIIRAKARMLEIDKHSSDTSTRDIIQPKIARIKGSGLVTLPNSPSEFKPLSK